MKTMTRNIPAYTVHHAAEQVGLTPGRVRQICQKFQIGTMITARMRLLSKPDIDSIKKISSQMKIGRPLKKA
jgi:hypothetical protein